MGNSNTDKNVYILGAGFSKELGLPLQDDFLMLAKEVYFRDPDKYKHFKEVFNYQNRLAKMRTFLNYPLLNLEHLFNLLEMDIFYSNKSEVKQLKNDFMRMIKDVFIELTPNPFFNLYDNIASNQQYAYYLSFLKMFVIDDSNINHIKFHKDTIISFNYDLIIEATTCIYNQKRNKDRVSSLDSIELLRLNVLFGKDNLKIDELSNYFTANIGGSIFENNRIYSNTAPSIKLIKLHGSVNWKEVDNDNLFLIPPTWNKSDTRVRRLWEIAFQEITEAKRIIIIGYSFPETDIYVKSLLALALNENEILQNIYFINPDKEQVKSRCLSLLDKHFEKYCDYKEWKFSDFINSPDGKTFIQERLHRRIS